MLVRHTLAILMLLTTALAQPKPHIDFYALLKSFPDLPWNFEIRYVSKDRQSTDMLRIHYDGRANVVRWRAEYAGSLASVCRAALPEGEFKKLLELMRDTNFNDLPTESESVISVANRGEQIVSVRLARTVVRKTDRGNLSSPELKRIQDELGRLLNEITSESKAECEMESVPARP